MSGKGSNRIEAEAMGVVERGRRVSDMAVEVVEVTEVVGEGRKVWDMAAGVVVAEVAVVME